MGSRSRRCGGEEPDRFQLTRAECQKQARQPPQAPPGPFRLGLAERDEGPDAQNVSCGPGDLGALHLTSRSRVPQGLNGGRAVPSPGRRPRPNRAQWLGCAQGTRGRAVL